MLRACGKSPSCDPAMAGMSDVGEQLLVQLLLLLHTCGGMTLMSAWRCHRRCRRGTQPWAAVRMRRQDAAAGVTTAESDTSCKLASALAVVPAARDAAAAEREVMPGQKFILPRGVCEERETCCRREPTAFISEVDKEA